MNSLFCLRICLVVSLLLSVILPWDLDCRGNINIGSEGQAVLVSQFDDFCPLEDICPLNPHCPTCCMLCSHGIVMHLPSQVLLYLSTHPQYLSLANKAIALSVFPTSIFHPPRFIS